MARPKKQPGEKRDQRFNLRFTLAEIEQLRAQALTAGLAPHEYARERVLGHRVQSSGDLQLRAALVSELNRIGVNLNQLAKTINAGRDMPQMAEVVLAELRGTLAQVVADDP